MTFPLRRLAPSAVPLALASAAALAAGPATDLPAAGRYRVSIEGLEGPDQAMVQPFRNEHAEGEAADLYAPQRRKGKIVRMGVLEMKEGQNQVFFKLVGKNPRSSGLGFDLIRLHFNRIREWAETARQGAASRLRARPSR